MARSCVSAVSLLALGVVLQFGVRQFNPLFRERVFFVRQVRFYDTDTAKTSVLIQAI